MNKAVEQEPYFIAKMQMKLNLRTSACHKNDTKEKLDF